ncbi:hypothetical protein AAC387_Pa06g1780 [Persea americana]
MKEMMNASGFGYDPVSKRVVADEVLWNTWLEGHPTTRPLKTKSIDYEKMGLKFNEHNKIVVDSHVRGSHQVRSGPAI